MTTQLEAAELGKHSEQATYFPVRFLQYPRTTPHLELERAHDGMRSTSPRRLESPASFAYQSETRSVPVLRSTLSNTAFLPMSAQQPARRALWFLLPWRAPAAPRSPPRPVAGDVHEL